MKICILGASGYLGSTLYDVMAADHQVVGTCCHCPSPGLVRYNMLRDDPENLPIDWNQIEAVVIAAGITRIEECAKDPQGTRQLNVAAVERFCQFAASRQFHVTFISTDHVYDGTPRQDGQLRMHHEQERPAPSTCYGQQKLAAEQCVAELVPRHLILRLSMNVTVARRFSAQQLGGRHLSRPAAATSYRPSALHYLGQRYGARLGIGPPKRSRRYL